MRKPVNIRICDKTGQLHNRVAEVGKLSASAKKPSILLSDAYLLICDKKNVVLSRITKTATKRQFLPSFTQFLPNFTQFYLVFTQFYLLLPSFYLVFTRQSLKFSSESKLFVKRRLCACATPATLLSLSHFAVLPFCNFSIFHFAILQESCGDDTGDERHTL